MEEIAEPVPGLDPFIDRFTVAGDAQEVREKVAVLAEMPEIGEVVITLPGAGGPLPLDRGDHGELCGGGVRGLIREPLA